jgi:Leucine-rich repeat (LRR) protein
MPLVSEKPKHLTVLDISDNKLRAAHGCVFKALATWLATNPNLTALDLSSTDTTVTLLDLVGEGLQENTNLRCLKLEYCPVRMYSDFAMLKSPVLKHLDISSTTLSDSGLALLFNACPSLEVLNIGGCEVTRQTCEVLKCWRRTCL